MGPVLCSAIDTFILYQKVGLVDATNTAPSNHGYVNRIRRDSVSGKGKEQKKATLVSTHSQKVSFKPTPGNIF